MIFSGHTASIKIEVLKVRILEIMNFHPSDFVFQVLPDAEFHIIPDAGHSNKEPGTEAKLLEACEKYKDL